MAFIDAHAHIYPGKIAERAVSSVQAFYGIEAMYSKEGTAESLLGTKDNAPLTHFIVHSVAVKPSNVTSINDFIAAECAAHPEFIGFMAMHQDFPDPEREIERAISLGLHGIKIHPDTQRVNADDPRFMDVYEIAQSRHLPVVIQTGDYRYDYSHPRRIARILQAFPDLVVDAAHFGGWSIFDVGADTLRSERCFVDTSSSFEFVGARHGHELIDLYGSDRVMFGSDFPMWNPAREYELLQEMRLSREEYERVTWHNAEAFLGFNVN